MDTLPSTPSPLPTKRPTAPEAPTPAQRKARAAEGESEKTGQTSVTGFSKLLQAAAQPDSVDATALGGLAAVADPNQALVPLLPSLVPVQPQAQLPADIAGGIGDPSGAEMGDISMTMMVGDATWTVQSLVGQTARLDQSADVALRNGSHVQARLDAGDPLGLMRSAAQTALGAAVQVPVVAQGVVQALGGGVMQAAAQGDVAGAAAWNAVSDTAQSVVDAMADAVKSDDGDALSRGDRSSEGRVSLQGQWIATDRQAQPAEVMQRLLGQMSQFLSATGATDAAGLRRSGSKSLDDAAASAQDAAAVSSGAGIGGGTGRLLDNAVAQAAAGQQTSNGDAQGAQAEPDMAFWMNSRQQRAEVVLDRDGEPVRVQVTMEGSTAHVTFHSDEQTTRSMLDASVAQLRDMLASQGVELAGVQVGAQAGGNQQGGSSAAQEAFMPEGARRVRLQSAAGVEQAPSLQRAGGASRQGVDIFA
ncbi:MAG: flagellar hook-length control protein FliK [Comamonas sp.]